MKKNILLAVLTGVLALTAGAQQLPLYSQLYFMRLLYNPALTAYNGSTNLYGFYRDQWTNIPGHPVTAGAVGDMSLWKDRIGTGFTVSSDNTDIIHHVNADLFYAQKVKLATDHLLSLGFSFGLQQTYVDYNNAIAVDANDPHILLNGKSGLGFDLSVGLAYQWKKLAVSFSVPEVFTTQEKIISLLHESDYSNSRNFVGGVSYEFSFDHEKYNLEPSVLVKSGVNLPYQIDGSVMFNYKRFIYVGAGYRMDYGVAGIAAVRISKCVTVGYSYEYPIMQNVGYSDTKGTHEVIFGINFDKWVKKKPINPKDFVKQTQFDSLQAAHDELKKKVDTAAQHIDSLQKGEDSLFRVVQGLEKQNEEHLQYEKELKVNLDSVQKMVRDSFETLANEYKQHVKEKPAQNFPSAVEKNNPPAGKGDIYRLTKVEFDKNSSYLQPASYGELNKLISYLNMNSGTHIRVMGHTCYLASDEYNQWLSDRRAKRVYDYLVEKGISPERMTYIGFGKTAPIADNNTEEGRTQNRRVEIEITK